MPLTTINTRSDLDALAGTPDHDAFMSLLAGTLWRIEKDDTAQSWVAFEDNTTIERFGFTRANFPDALPPVQTYEPETLDQARTRLQLAVQAHLDAAAQADGWNSIYTASLRSAFPGPWQAKGIAYASWMDACWDVCFQVQEAVAAGTRPVPTDADLIAELPGLVLP